MAVQAEAVARVVEQAGADIDRHVVEVLLDKFQLTAHCAAIKRYLLLGQVPSAHFIRSKADFTHLSILIGMGA